MKKTGMVITLILAAAILTGCSVPLAFEKGDIYCTHCGKILSTSNYCKYCGEQLNVDVAANDQSAVYECFYLWLVLNDGWQNYIDDPQTYAYTSGCDYYLCDIDRNGTDEIIIVGRGNPIAEGWFIICGAQESETGVMMPKVIVCSGCADTAEPLYSKDSDVICMYSYHGGLAGFDMLEIENNEVVSAREFTLDIENGQTFENTVTESPWSGNYEAARQISPDELLGVGNGDRYCSQCGKKISYTNNFCPHCGANLNVGVSVSVHTTVPSPANTPDSVSISNPVNTPVPAPVQTPMPTLSTISFGRNERTVCDRFKSTQTAYNVFDYEVQNCCGCFFYYSAQKSGNSATGCTGTRDVYVRSRDEENCKNDKAWIYVGSFEYPIEGESMAVELTWMPTDVYAMAVVRNNLSSYCSYSASWGDQVTLVYY